MLRIDAADKVFSQFIRLRDMKCARCGSQVNLNDNGLPISHQASHYFGRGRENTRFDPENVDTLCMGCHRIWGSDDRESYRNFKLNQLGKRGHDLLTIRANTTTKKDRKMSLLVAKELLKNLYTDDS